MAIDIERAKRTPSEYFAAPRDVAKHKELAKADKIEILLRWRYHALQLETAQGENMQAEEDSGLGEVMKALDELGYEED